MNLLVVKDLNMSEVFVEGDNVDEEVLNVISVLMMSIVLFHEDSENYKIHFNGMFLFMFVFFIVNLLKDKEVLKDKDNF